MVEAEVEAVAPVVRVVRDAALEDRVRVRAPPARRRSSRPRRSGRDGPPTGSSVVTTSIRRPIRRLLPTGPLERADDLDRLRASSSRRRAPRSRTPRARATPGSGTKAAPPARAGASAAARARLRSRRTSAERQPAARFHAVCTVPLQRTALRPRGRARSVVVARRGRAGDGDRLVRGWAGRRPGRSAARWAPIMRRADRRRRVGVEVGDHGDAGVAVESP